MLMMFVVPVLVAVQHAFMGVFVPMSLAQVQPDTDAHQYCRHPERRWCRLAEQQDAQGRADEGDCGEIGAGA